MKKLSLNPKKKIEALLESKVLGKVVPKAVELIKSKGADKAAEELVAFATKLLEQQAGAIIPKPLKKKTTQIVKKVAIQVVEKAIAKAMELMERSPEPQAQPQPKPQPPPAVIPAPLAPQAPKRAFLAAAGIGALVIVASIAAVTAGADAESDADDPADDPVAATKPTTHTPPVAIPKSLTNHLPRLTTWDGKTTFRCAGDDKVVLSNVTSTIDRPISAIGNCQLTCMNCRLRSPSRGVLVAGNARVTLVRSTITGTKWALFATGNARVFVVASNITGKQLRNGNAAITRRDPH